MVPMMMRARVRPVLCGSPLRADRSGLPRRGPRCLAAPPPRLPRAPAAADDGAATGRPVAREAGIITDKEVRLGKMASARARAK
eukprot:5874759-Pyramimonas_sp.AAC.1